SRLIFPSAAICGLVSATAVLGPGEPVALRRALRRTVGYDGNLEERHVAATKLSDRCTTTDCRLVCSACTGTRCQHNYRYLAGGRRCFALRDRELYKACRRNGQAH